MEHRLGTVNLIRWQARRNRRLKSGVPIGTVVLVACAVAGATAMGAQALGVLVWSGPLAALPAALVVLSVGAQIVAVGKAVVTWLVG